MSVTSRSPLRMAGAAVYSGSVNTGELNHVRGGGIAACIYSGGFGPSLVGAPGSIVSGGNVLFFSGGGRLNSILTHTTPATTFSLSGIPIVLYDSAIITLSGVSQAASGQRILAYIGSPGGVSGQLPISAIYNLDVPFQSGLCAQVLSGTPGFTLTYSPEVNLPNPG